MANMTYMDFAVSAAHEINDNWRNTEKVVKRLLQLSKKDAVLATAYICDQLSGTEGYHYFLTAVAR